MFYFTCNESKIYERFTFWNKLQEKLFHDILIYWDAPVYFWSYNFDGFERTWPGCFFHHKPTATLATSGESPWEKDGNPEHFRLFCETKKCQGLGTLTAEHKQATSETDSHNLTHKQSILHAFWGSNT